MGFIRRQTKPDSNGVGYEMSESFTSDGDLRITIWRCSTEDDSAMLLYSREDPNEGDWEEIDRVWNAFATNLPDAMASAEDALIQTKNDSIWNSLAYSGSESLVVEVSQNREGAKKTVLEEARDLVYGDRNAQYGHPRDDYARVAKMWSAFLGVEITPEQAASMMIFIKMSRLAHKPKRDTIVDIAGYAQVVARILDMDE